MLPRACFLARTRARAPVAVYCAPHARFYHAASTAAAPLRAPCRELWRQSRGKAIRAASKYTVGLETNESAAAATVRVKYADGRSLDVAAQGLGVPDLIDALLAPTEAMREKEDKMELEKN